MQLETIIREHIGDSIHLSLATCDLDIPWITEVHFVFDDQLYLYFRSLPSRRHSQELQKNPRVSGNIIQQHARLDPVFGIYFEGTCSQIDIPNDQILFLFQERLGADPDTIRADAQSPDGHQFYKISVSQFFVFDGRTPPATKLSLPWNYD